MATHSIAFVGAVGGVGTTRLTMECATLLAEDGRDVAVIDAAYATQGLADLTPGRIDPDVTKLCLDDAPLENGLVDRQPGGAGRLAVCPARAPFERIARAKTREAAEALQARIDEAVRAFEYVLIDVPPIAANQAVAAVTSAEDVAVVCDAARASAAIPRIEDRLIDVGVNQSRTIVTRANDHPSADATVPTFATDVPAVETDPGAHSVIAELLETIIGVVVERKDDGSLRSKLF